MDTAERLDGAGPWLFEADALEPGDSYSIDFQNRTHNKTKGYFRQFLPLDDLQITNSHDSSPLSAELNHSFNARIGPNTAETFGDVGVTHLQITNAGPTATEAGDVVIEVSSAAWDSDKEARATRKRREQQPPAVTLIRDLLPGVDR